MGGCGAISLPIVQIHPTRHCNLQCRHCYSMSGPKVQEALGQDAIARFLGEARAQGYAVASFSGGEPLIYPHFFESAAAAGALGFAVSVTTNGMLIDEACAERLARHVGLVAVSIDGPRDLHNRMRGSAAAFDGAMRGIAALRAAGMRFAIIHTVTPASLPHLRWMVDFAREQDAGLLQLHPLEGVGRALEEMPGESLDDAATTRAGLLAAIIAETDSMPLQVDLFSRELIDVAPRMILADEEGRDADAPLSALVNPLILESNGDVTPLTHGFGRRFRVCNIAQQTLAEALPAFRAEVYPHLRAVSRQLRRDILAEPEMPFLNWYERITQASLRPAEPAATR